MKKLGFLTLLMMALLLFSLAFPVAAAGPTAPLAPIPAAAAAPATPAAAAVPPEHHPEIVAALEAMRNAKEHLEHAAHDFGGHRVKSLEHLQRAIEEAEICNHMDQ